jgi:glycosyltransferase involved in cell wall biosynthesis
MKKKIVHIGMPYSGVGSYIKQIAKYSDHKSLELYLLCNLKHENVLIEGIDKPNILHINLKRQLNPFVDFICLMQIIRHLIYIKPNLIHCHSSKPGLLARISAVILGIPSFYTPNAFAFLNTKSALGSKIFLLVERVMAKLPGALLACSEKELEISRKIVKFKKNKSLIWSNSIYPIEKEYNFSCDNTKKEQTLASIGRICHQKNFDMVVDVMKIIIHKGHNIKLNIYGAGYYSPEKNSLLKKINDFGLEKNIIIHDYIDRSIMLKKLNKSIIYISTARYEGLPYAIMEAMSLGLPCIVTDVEGNNELVKDGINGYLISPFNSKDMASRIIELIEDNENRELFGQKAKQIFNDEHNIENNIKKLKKLYQQHGR